MWDYENNLYFCLHIVDSPWNGQRWRWSKMKKEDPLYTAHILSCSSCLDQNNTFYFQIFVKKLEEISWSDKLSSLEGDEVWNKGFYLFNWEMMIFNRERVLWCLTPLSTIFQLYRGNQFYWWRKPEYPEKTTDLSHVTHKFYHNVVSSTPHQSGVQTHNVRGDRNSLHR
jgi:hypothetical protein